MKRLIFLVVALFSFALIGSPAQAAVDNLTITDYKIDFQLGRDEDGRSTLKTTEIITAVFPMDDQNHGLERFIPKSYDYHKTSLKIESVKKPDGSKWEYEDTTNNDNVVLRIGDPDKYLHGTHTFVIIYTQRDVTRYFENTNRDEFYWDTNGTGWRVPIERLEVNLTVDQALMAQFTGDKACYIGSFRSSDTCDLSQQGNTFSAVSTSLLRGQNITVSLGFEPRTFGQYQKSLADVIIELWLISVLVFGLTALIPFVWLLVMYGRWKNRKNQLGTVVPEYLPPPDASVATSATLVSNPKASFTAQLLDLAVRHYIKIYEVREKSLFRAAQYEIEIIRSIKDLRDEEQEILNDIFPSTSIGSRLALKDLKNNYSVGKKTLDNESKLSNLIENTYDIRHVDPYVRTKFYRVGKWLLVPAVLLLNPVFFVASMLAFGFGHSIRPLTDKGLDLYRYLEGLKLYIGVAEAERIAMLQSPEGAAKVGEPVDANDNRQLIKLYERVLPYAVLFGQEKEWNKRIGNLYESSGNQPDWYGGNSAFNALAFSSAMHSFSSAAATSSASSSTSGGSSGGGFSGGGGGGGGGGGW